MRMYSAREDHIIAILKERPGSALRIYYDESESTHWYLHKGKRFSFILSCSPYGYFMPFSKCYRNAWAVDMAMLERDWDEITQQ